MNKKGNDDREIKGTASIFEQKHRLETYIKTGLLVPPFTMEDWVTIISDEDLLYFYGVSENAAKCNRCLSMSGGDQSKCDLCITDGIRHSFTETEIIVKMLAIFEKFGKEAFQYNYSTALGNFLKGIIAEVECRFGGGVLSGERSVLSGKFEIKKHGNLKKVEKRIKEIRTV